MSNLLHTPVPYARDGEKANTDSEQNAATTSSRSVIDVVGSKFVQRCLLYGLLTAIAEFCRSGISVAGNALHFAERNFPTQEIDDWREQFLRVFFKNLARLVKLIGSAPVSTSF
jgi:hypothetical protein